MSKYFINTTLMIALLAVAVLVSCKKNKGDDDDDDDDDDDITAALAGTWTYDEVTQNGGVPFGDWTSFQLVFNEDGTYSSSGAPSTDPEVPFANTTGGTYTVNTNATGGLESIDLSGGPTLTNVSVATTLEFDFVYDPAARVAHVGSYSVTLVRP